MIYYYNPRKLTFQEKVFAILAGLTGSLFVVIPTLGAVAILDLVAYAIGPILLFSNFRKMGHEMRRAVFFSFGWTLAAVFANMLNFIDMKYTLKSITLVAISWATMGIAFPLLRRDARLFFWYLVGYGVALTVGLYYFKQGTVLFREAHSTGMTIEEILMEKERYPRYAKTIFYSGLLLLSLIIGKLPRFLTAIGCLFCSFFLLLYGGSRANFGIFLMSSMFGFATVFFKRILVLILRNGVALAFAIIISAGSIFLTYSHLAASGAIGDGERMKYEREFGAGEGLEDNIIARGGYADTFDNLLSQPWGVGGTMQRHSVISNALNCEGIFGGIYWLYFIWLAIWFVRHRAPSSNRFAPFLLLIITSLLWDIIGSPFAHRHLYFFLMTFFALCKDSVKYGAGTVFYMNESKPWRMVSSPR